jgi:hypothetical protein
MDAFRTAYDRARAKIGVDKWAHLSNVEQERAVAEEFQKLTERPVVNDNCTDPRIPI